MSEADNRRLVEEAYDALNAYDLDRYGKLVDDSYIVETVASSTPIRGREAVKQLAETYFKAFPDSASLRPTKRLAFVDARSRKSEMPE